MIVMPFTCARTSRRRFTLLKVFNATTIFSLGIPHPDARAAAAVAFITLHSAPSANSKSAQLSPFVRIVHEVTVGSSRRLVTCHEPFFVVPYRSTGQNARARQ